MEHQLIDMGQVAEPDFTPADSTSRMKHAGLPCGLPLGKPLVCGDARHREDRPSDTEVISGSSPSHDVWFIRTGILRLQRYAHDGRRQILTLFLPGEIVGFEAEFREGISVETVTQSALCRIDRRKFETMLSQSDTLRAELIRQKQDQLDRLHWLTWSVGALGPEERLCAFLALSSKFMPFQPLHDGTVVLSMLLPRKDIADLLATTVETISRILHRLSEASVIEIKDATHFRVLDLKELIALGQIDGHFDRMSRALAERRNRLDALTVLRPDCPVCFCGR